MKIRVESEFSSCLRPLSNYIVLSINVFDVAMDGPNLRTLRQRPILAQTVSDFLIFDMSSLRR